MMSARSPAPALAEHCMRAEADLVLIGRIVAAFKATPPQHVNWTTAGDASRLTAMLRDVIEVFGSEVTR